MGATPSYTFQCACARIHLIHSRLGCASCLIWTRYSLFFCSNWRVYLLYVNLVLLPSSVPEDLVSKTHHGSWFILRICPNHLSRRLCKVSLNIYNSFLILSFLSFRIVPITLRMYFDCYKYADIFVTCNLFTLSSVHYGWEKYSFTNMEFNFITDFSSAYNGVSTNLIIDFTCFLILFEISWSILSDLLITFPY